MFMAGLMLVIVTGTNVLTGRIKQGFDGLNVQTTKLILALERVRLGSGTANGSR